MRRATAAVGALSAALALVPVLASPGRADTRSVSLHPTADAWYATSPVCATLPVGCGSGPATTSYPAGTLHVGATGGQEAARAYLTFSTPQLVSAQLVSASLVIPVDPAAGTNAPDTSAITLCVVPAGLPAPAPQAAPAADCSLSTAASYLPGSPATVEADLAPFASRLAGGSLTLAVVPTPVTAAAAVTDTWGIAFSGRQRTGSSVPAPALELSLVPTPATPEPVASEGPVLVAAPPAVTAVAPLTAPSAPEPSVVVPTPPVVVAPQQPGRLVAASFTIRGGRYGTFWAVPLLLFLLGWGVRSLGSRDLRSYSRPGS
jgi:hypothetical protein